LVVDLDFKSSTVEDLALGLYHLVSETLLCSKFNAKMGTKEPFKISPALDMIDFRMVIYATTWYTSTLNLGGCMVDIV
jgi:hypothetical protein